MYAAVETLAHFFYPRHSNNQKAKLLHSSTIFILIFVLIAYQLALSAFPFWGLKVLGYAASIPSDEVIRLTNQKRMEVGLSPLELSPTLAQAAKAKGQDMLTKGYWAHTSPDGVEPWKFFTDAGYTYRYAGENLARDFSNPQSAVEAWIASPSHKENMLSSKYKDIGIAVVEGNLAGVDTTIIVQFFGTRLSQAPQVPVARAASEVKPTPTGAPTPMPTPTPTRATAVIAQVSPSPSPTLEKVATAGPTGPTRLPVLISPFDTTKGVSLATVTLLLTVLVIDGVVVSRRKIPRIGGRTFAHLAFLGMILALVLIAKAGRIL